MLCGADAQREHRADLLRGCTPWSHRTLSDRRSCLLTRSDTRGDRLAFGQRDRCAAGHARRRRLPHHGRPPGWAWRQPGRCSALLALSLTANLVGLDQTATPPRRWRSCRHGQDQRSVAAVQRNAAARLQHSPTGRMMGRSASDCTSPVVSTTAIRPVPAIPSATTAPISAHRHTAHGQTREVGDQVQRGGVRRL